MTCSCFFRRYNVMGSRVFTGQKMFREKFKVRDRNFILCQGIDIGKENQIKLKHCLNLKDYFLNKEVNLLKMYQS